MTKYRRKTVRRRNPVPASSTEEQLQQAAAAFGRFTGHDAEEAMRAEIPPIPKAVWLVGELDVIDYTAVRDGVTEHYTHSFKANARPMLVSSPDGSHLWIVGGCYRVTELGIVDNPK